jgi:hypothetical protein
VSFEELLKTSDVLSLNLPLNVGFCNPPFVFERSCWRGEQKQTRHIISTKEFEQMKKGVVIVNTARGAVMDEDALVKALESGQVWSCGLDVFEEEPKIHPGLLSNPSVMLLPHMGTWTVETQTKMEIWCIDNVKSAIVKGKLMSPVGEQKDMWGAEREAKKWRGVGGAFWKRVRLGMVICLRLRTKRDIDRWNDINDGWLCYPLRTDIWAYLQTKGNRQVRNK